MHSSEVQGFCANLNSIDSHSEVQGKSQVIAQYNNPQVSL